MNKEPVAEKERSSNLPVSEQERAIVELHEYIIVLEDLLRPVLTPALEREKTLEQTEPSKAISPLAERLQNNNQGIYDATNKLRNIISRVEC